LNEFDFENGCPSLSQNRSDVKTIEKTIELKQLENA
jgi:hypothetical protein